MIAHYPFHIDTSTQTHFDEFDQFHREPCVEDTAACDCNPTNRADGWFDEEFEANDTDSGGYAGVDDNGCADDEIDVNADAGVRARNEDNMAAAELLDDAPDV